MAKSVTVTKVRDGLWKARCVKCKCQITAGTWTKAASWGWRHRC